MITKFDVFAAVKGLNLSVIALAVMAGVSIMVMAGISVVESKINPAKTGT